jgi:hypothetical protein
MSKLCDEGLKLSHLPHRTETARRVKRISLRFAKFKLFGGRGDELNEDEQAEEYEKKINNEK